MRVDVNCEKIKLLATKATEKMREKSQHITGNPIYRTGGVVDADEQELFNKFVHLASVAEVGISHNLFRFSFLLASILVFLVGFRFIVITITAFILVISFVSFHLVFRRRSTVVVVAGQRYVTTGARDSDRCETSLELEVVTAQLTTNFNREVAEELSGLLFKFFIFTLFFVIPFDTNVPLSLGENMLVAIGQNKTCWPLPLAAATSK
jgi:hypothetical protein